MSLKLKITSVPLGIEPREIREQWLGISIPIPFVCSTLLDPSFYTSIIEAHQDQCYCVRKEDAISALEEAGKKEAVEYCRQNLQIPSYFSFPYAHATLEGENPPGFSEEELWQYAIIEWGYKGECGVNAINDFISEKGFCAIFDAGKYFLEPWDNG